MARVNSSNFVQRMENGIFWIEETPVGSINGSNKTFTLTYSPNPVSSCEYIVNGQEQHYTTDYSVSGDGLTTVVGFPVGTAHILRYRVEPQ